MTPGNLVEWKNPNGADLGRPFLYYIRILSPRGELGYVGKASHRSRLSNYKRNVERLFAGETKRPNTSGANPHNERYRYVHGKVAEAFMQGWQVEHIVLRNVAPAHLAEEEQREIRQRNSSYPHGMNNGPGFSIEEFKVGD